VEAIDSDIRDMEREARAMEGKEGSVPADLHRSADEPALACSHTPPGTFQSAEPVALVLDVEDEARTGLEVHLHYRHVNQAETYEIVRMQPTGSGFRAVIPGEYTQSPYALQYWFELRDSSGEARFWPGLDADLSNQPYFVVRAQGHRL